MNQITYNGTPLSSYGVYYDSSLSYISPEKDYELVEVLGRDGALAIYNDRFRTVELSIPCYIKSNFITNYRNLMSFLNSQKGYQRMELTQEPNHFRKALLMALTSPDTGQFVRDGQFSIIFTCMPQRFLKSGETPVEIPSQSTTYTGNPVSIDNPSGASAVSSLTVELLPIQAGTGDPSPSNVRPITGHTEVEVAVTNGADTNTYTTDLVSTVYGGTLDVTTGVLTVTHITHTIDPQRINSVTVLGTNVRSGLYSPDGFIPSTGENALAVSNILPRVAKNYSADVTGFYFYNATGMYIKLPVASLESSDLTGFRKFLTDNPMEVVYPLGTPTTVQLTAKHISLLTGTNTISSDGDLTIDIAEPSLLVNPTLFESKPLIRVYGSGTLNINDLYIIVSANSYPYIDIDCELMDARHGMTNCNSYVSFSTTDYVTLRAGNNYIAPSGFTKVEITPRWYEI